MNLYKISPTIAAVFLVALFATGCADNNAEQVGEEIDEAITDVGNAVEDACEDVKEGVNADDTDC